MKKKIIQLCILLFVLTTGCKNKIDEVYELKDLDLKDKAIEEVNKIISEDPKNAEAYFALANIYAELNKRNEALQNFENALKIEPENVRFRSHKFFFILLRDRPNSEYFDEITQKIVQNDPNNFLGYALLAQAYNVGVSELHYSDDKNSVQNFINYIEAISKLNKLKPFSSYQTLYSNQIKKQVNSTQFLIINNKVNYYDSNGKSAGELTSETNIRIDSVLMDTIYFTDPVAYSLDSRKAWRIKEVTMGWPGFNWPKYYDANKGILYIEPLCAYSDFDNDDRYYDKSGVQFSATVQNAFVEQGSIKATGRTKQYTAYSRCCGQSYVRPTIYDWEEVEYKAKVFLKRKLPISKDIILFKDDFSAKLFRLLNQANLNNELSNQILKAGYIAYNMTPDLVNLSIDAKLMKTEFNKDNFKKYYDYGESKLIFTDGLLTDIKVSAKDL